MDKEKKKLLLVAVSVGVFLVIIFSAAILLLMPRAPTGAAAFSASHPVLPGTGGAAFQPPAVMDNQAQAQPREGDLAGIHIAPVTTATHETNVFIGAEAFSAEGETTVTITVPRPTTAAVPDTPVTAAPRPAPAARPQAPAAQAPAAQARPVQQAPAPAAAAARPPAQAPTPAAVPQARPAPAQQRVQNDYWIQTGAFTARIRAEGAREMLASKGITSIIENRIVDGRTWYRVRVGPYTTEEEANHWLTLVQSIDGFNNSQVRQTVSVR